MIPPRASLIGAFVAMIIYDRGNLPEQEENEGLCGAEVERNRNAKVDGSIHCALLQIS